MDVDGYRVLEPTAPAVSNALAAILLCLRNLSGSRLHRYFEWSEGHPIAALLRYLLFGEGDTAPVTRGRCCARSSTTPRSGPPSTSAAEGRPVGYFTCRYLAV